MWCILYQKPWLNNLKNDISLFRDSFWPSGVPGGHECTTPFLRRERVESWCVQDDFPLWVLGHEAKWMGRNHFICGIKWGWKSTSGTLCPHKLYLFAIHQLLLSFISICNVNDHLFLKLRNDVQLRNVIESAQRKQMEVFPQYEYSYKNRELNKRSYINTCTRGLHELVQQEVGFL